MNERKRFGLDEKPALAGQLQRHLAHPNTLPEAVGIIPPEVTQQFVAGRQQFLPFALLLLLHLSGATGGCRNQTLKRTNYLHALHIAHMYAPCMLCHLLQAGMV